MKRGILLALMVLLMVPTSGGTADGGLNYIDKDALKDMLGAPNLLIIDVRQPGDWNSSAKKIPGAVRQDPDQVAAWGPNLPKDKKIVLYCAWPNEGTSARVAQHLVNMGVSNVSVLKGGWKAWEAAGFPMEAKSK